ncbi:MAG TPA: hypothetical protein VJY85_09930, partial [Candidatus Limnocylindria bacterium]|nr:hypothetical protein [Candidatus Limnocylindria bacterium]
MHTSSGPRPKRRTLATLITGALAVALTVLGLPAVALAGSEPASTTTSTAKADPSKPSVTAACATAKKGYATCFALRRDDVTGARGVIPLLDPPPAGYGPADIQSAYS